MPDIFHFGFMQNALMAGLLISIACGIIGSLVVVNRMVFLSGGIAHAAYGGLGLAIFLHLPPVLGAAVFSLAIAMIMGAISLRNRERADAMIGVLWAAGMAFGIILIDLTPGYYSDVMSYLFGSILAVPHWDIVFMAVMDIVIIALMVLFYKEFQALSFDQEFCEARGVPVKLLYFLLMGMIAMSVVMMIRVVGLILIIALLTIPVFIAEQWTHTLKRMMALSSVFGMVFTLSGLLLSYYFNLTSGATIILVAAAAFFILLFVKHLFPQRLRW